MKMLIFGSVLIVLGWLELPTVIDHGYWFIAGSIWGYGLSTVFESLAREARERYNNER